MNSNAINILLADDDKDDCILFKDALEELPLSTNLTTIHDGEKLMTLLRSTRKLPEVLFLDLNMPRKNGFECLSEIRRHKNLRHLPVIIFSTSFDQEIVKLLYKNGAHYYIRKPNDFERLKQVIYEALRSAIQTKLLQPSLENFVLLS